MFYTKTFYNLVIITIDIQQVNPMVELSDYKVISVKLEEQSSGHGITVRFWNHNAIAFKTLGLGIGSEVLITNLAITSYDWTCSLSSTDYTTIKVNSITYLSPNVIAIYANLYAVNFDSYNILYLIIKICS